MTDKIIRLLVPADTSLKEALSRMDAVGYKLLMVADDKQKLLGLITIGDIQRAIIANQSLDAKALPFGRKDLIVATESDAADQIREQMLQLRLVYMPVLNSAGVIKDVIFWDDIISEAVPQYDSLKLPVVIMAGGFGTRLKPLTNVLPKPLLPYGETTILENIIQRFRKYDCTQFDISVNYKAGLIEYYFDSIEDKDYDVHFFTEDRPLGTAGSLHLLSDKLKTPFFVSNCDILIEEDYSEIYKYHKQHQNELTIVASVKSYHIPYGTIESGENGVLVALREKPQLDYLINCGMYILEPHLLKEIPKDTFFHITDLIEMIKQREGRVGVFPISERSWVDIGEWQFYSKILMK